MCMEYKIPMDKQLEEYQSGTQSKSVALLLFCTVVHGVSALNVKFEQREIMLRAQTYLREGNILPKNMQPSLLALYHKALEV